MLSGYRLYVGSDISECLSQPGITIISVFCPLLSWNKNGISGRIEKTKARFAHIYGHQVDEQEVEDVLKHPGEDRPGREGSRVAIGQSRAGRCIRVIYVPDPELDSVFVITAYQLSGKALFAYRRRRRKKS